MDIALEVTRAEQRIRSRVRETPLEPSEALGPGGGQGRLLLKCENLQHTGSFKARGALNALLSLSSEERARGVVAASSGNHGAAVAWGLRALGAQGTIFVPEGASSTKVAAIRRQGAEVRAFGDDASLAEGRARAFAAERGMPYISPYNDARVIAGQGTVAVELCRQLERINAVFVPVGGGGLVSGIAGYLKAVLPGVRVIGCQPEASPVMARSVEAGAIVDIPSGPTLSDGTAGGIEPGAITLPLCRSLVDEFVLITEDQIREALRLVLETHHLLIEGAAGRRRRGVPPGAGAVPRRRLGGGALRRQHQPGDAAGRGGAERTSAPRHPWLHS